MQRQDPIGRFSLPPALSPLHPRPARPRPPPLPFSVLQSPCLPPARVGLPARLPQGCLWAGGITGEGDARRLTGTTRNSPASRSAHAPLLSASPPPLTSPVPASPLTVHPETHRPASPRWLRGVSNWAPRPPLQAGPPPAAARRVATTHTVPSGKTALDPGCCRAQRLWGGHAPHRRPEGSLRRGQGGPGLPRRRQLRGAAPMPEGRAEAGLWSHIRPALPCSILRPTPPHLFFTHSPSKPAAQNPRTGLRVSET